MKLCPEPLWEELCRADPTCTFFQTPAWHGIAARYYQAESIPLLFKFGDQVACLPLLRKRRWGFYRYFSPFGTYTALVAATQLKPEVLHSIEKSLRNLHLDLVSSPFTVNPLSVGTSKISRVQVIDLKALDPNNLLRDWEEGQQRRLRVARREGVEVRLANSSAEWERYFELYQLTLKRWGDKTRVRYAKNLFDDIQLLITKKIEVKLWIAEHQNQIGAGYITFYHNRHVIPWHGAADNAFFSKGATQSLFFTIINDALQKGYAYFDLTGSGGLAGVEVFKSRFGTKTVEFRSSLNRPGIWAVVDFLRRK